VQGADMPHQPLICGAWAADPGDLICFKNGNQWVPPLIGSPRHAETAQQKGNRNKWHKQNEDA
jgi:hypothetical protein